MINEKFKIILLTSAILLASFIPSDVIKSEKKNNSIFVEFFRPIHKPISINGDNGFTVDNGVIAGNGTVKNPFIIANWNIRVSVTDIFKEIDGISIKNTKAYFVIDNCFIHFLDGRLAHIITTIKGLYGSNGINLYNVSNGKIVDCYIYGMDGSINIENNSHNNIIKRCICVRNMCGIGINRFSNNNMVEKCETRNYGCSICLWDDTHNNRVLNCSCKKVPIKIYNSSKNQIMGCTMSYCKKGMCISDNSHNNTIYDCDFFCNLKGLIIDKNSKNNFVFCNNFRQNLKSAYDNGINQWDNGTMGNYWSDFKDVDENIDGIWDNGRSICGGDNVDRFPLKYPISK